MQTSTQTIVRTTIVLDKSEEFTFMYLRYSFLELPWRVNAIEVQGGCFFVFGGPGRNKRGASLRFNYGFRSVALLPTMPTYIADEVESALRGLSAALSHG